MAARCRHAARWPTALPVAVKLSSAPLRRGDAWLDEVRQALAASGLAVETCRGGAGPAEVQPIGAVCTGPAGVFRPACS
jgi:hypothetical protein